MVIILVNPGDYHQAFNAAIHTFSTVVENISGMALATRAFDTSRFQKTSLGYETKSRKM